jgi:hypothetical protein
VKPVAKTATAKAAKKPVAKAVKPVAKKAAAKKPVKKVTPEVAATKKSVVKAVPEKTVPKKQKAKKAEGESIESLITQRDVDLKSVEEALGIKYDSTKDHPLIPGKFDMIIPPGTPRKLIVNMAKEFNLEVAQRNDYYVPIGISDIQRELLVFRGDQKTIEKANKEFVKRLKAWAK